MGLAWGGGANDKVGGCRPVIHLSVLAGWGPARVSGHSGQARHLVIPAKITAYIRESPGNSGRHLLPNCLSAGPDIMGWNY